MQREKIREQLSFLEEQLERLQSVATSNERYPLDSSDAFRFEESLILDSAKKTFSELQSLVREETLRQKSLPASEFLGRVVRTLIQMANEAGYDIAVTHYGEGRVSLEMVEVSMSAILSCMRASLRSYRGMGRAQRMKHRLFVPFSFYLEVKASLDEIHFRIVDDGQGYTGSLRTQFDTEKHFKGIRGEIARSGGWFKRKSFERFGGLIEFKMPLKRMRFESVILSNGTEEVLVPAHCISGITEGTNLPPAEEEPGVTFAKFNGVEGLIECSREQAAEAPCVVRVGVADFQLWIACDSAARTVLARRYPAADFVESGSWYSQFGLLHDEGDGRALPLLDGDVLLDFHGKIGKDL